MAHQTRFRHRQQPRQMDRMATPARWRSSPISSSVQCKLVAAGLCFISGFRRDRRQQTARSLPDPLAASRGISAIDDCFASAIYVLLPARAFRQPMCCSSALPNIWDRVIVACSPHFASLNVFQRKPVTTRIKYRFYASCCGKRGLFCDVHRLFTSLLIFGLIVSMVSC